MDAGPVNIYLDLEPGQKPDLEATARAMLAFTAAVNELAYVIDPGLEVRIDLGSGLIDQSQKATAAAIQIADK
jgi:hypothetical protein